MWSLLKTLADWHDYCARLCGQAGLQPDLVDFGRGPREYPCLVCGTKRDATAFISAFVYLENARFLLRHAQELFGAAATAAPGQPPAVIPQNLPASYQPPGQPVTSEQAEFNHAHAADMLTVIWAVVELGAIKKETFYAKRAEFTALIDQVTAERRDGHALLVREQQLRDAILPD